MPERYKKILIVNTFGIGDVLFSTPMLRALKTRLPDSQIDFVCNRRCREILRHNKNINEIMIFEKDEFRDAFRASKLDFVKRIIKITKKIRQKNYDLVVDLSLGYRLSFFLMLLGAKRRIGFNYRNRGRFLTDKMDITGFNGKHVVAYYLDILKVLGIGDFVTKNLEMYLDPEHERWADTFLAEKGLKGKTLVGLAPGGGKSWGKYAVYRRWSPENFNSIALKLLEKKKDIFFLIFGSKEEGGLCGVIEQRLGRNCVNLCGKTPLNRSMALIKRCRLLLCNDGGILHIAVSQGVETVSIFGPVDEVVYGPYPPSGKHKVVKATGVKCRPCYKNFKHAICETHDCLKKIDSDLVLKLAEESLGV